MKKLLVLLVLFGTTWVGSAELLVPIPPDVTTSCATGESYVSSLGGTVSVPVASGYTYEVTVSGVYFANDSIYADGEYSTRLSPWTAWFDSVPAYEHLGEGLLEMKVDDAFVEWGDYTDSHTYTLEYTAISSTIEFQIYDTFPSNNTGGLCVGVVYENSGVITSPSDGDILLTGDELVLGFDYDDDDYDPTRWAVRHNAGASCSGGTVVGNVDGHSDGFTWDGTTFAASFNTTGWATGDYCFVINPLNESTENQIREIRQFRIADGHINGGGQIIEQPEDVKSKDAFKVSFGGELWRFGSTVECDWTVQFHSVSNLDVSGGVFHGSTCSQPGIFTGLGADGITNMNVWGTFNGQPGYKLRMTMEDYSEPGLDDTIKFILYNQSGAEWYNTDGSDDFPGVSTRHGTARTEIDRGNLQIDLR